MAGRGASTDQPNGEAALSFQDVLPILRSNIRFLLLAALTCFLLAVVGIKVAGPSYIARMVLGPAPGLPQTNGSSLLSGGLASIGAGLGLSGLLGGAHSPEYERFEELLHSQRVAARIERKHHVMQHLFQKKWDAAKGRWKQPGGPIDFVVGVVREFFGLPAWQPPDTYDLTEKIGDRMTISDTKDTNLRQVEFKDESHEFAMNMLQWLYEEADGSIRDDDIARTRAEINYLKQELEYVTSVEHRQALTNLLESQEQRQMLLLSKSPYGAMVVVPAEAPSEPNSPKILLILALAPIVGALLSSIYLLWRAMELKRALLASGVGPEEAKRTVRASRTKIKLDAVFAVPIRQMGSKFSRSGP